MYILCNSCGKEFNDLVEASLDHVYGLKPRIVRIGTHKENNFQSRISEHFLLNESKMNFTIAKIT